MTRKPRKIRRPTEEAALSHLRQLDASGIDMPRLEDGSRKGKTTKSRADLKLEEMTAERDHWRGIAQRNKAENIELHEEIERLNIHVGAMLNPTDIVRRYDDAIKGIQVQRDTLHAVIDAVCSEANAMAKDATQLAQAANERFEQRTEGQSIRHISRLCARIYAEIDSDRTDTYNELVKKTEVIERTSHTEPLLFLETALEAAATSGAKLMGALALDYSLAFADDVATIAGDILRECRATGKPDMEAINNLPVEWMKALETSPAVKTFADGLEMAHKYRTSGMNQLAFCDFNRVSDRRLRIYTDWWDTLEDAERKGAESSD